MEILIINNEQTNMDLLCRISELSLLLGMASALLFSMKKDLTVKQEKTLTIIEKEINRIFYTKKKEAL